MEVDSFLSEAVGWETISDDLGSDLQAASPLLVRPTREHPCASWPRSPRPPRRRRSMPLPACWANSNQSPRRSSCTAKTPLPGPSSASRPPAAWTPESAWKTCSAFPTAPPPRTTPPSSAWPARPSSIHAGHAHHPRQQPCGSIHLASRDHVLRVSSLTQIMEARRWSPAW